VAKRDYYEVLGCAKTATEQELKSSYRKLAHKFHPDKNPGDKAAEESFKEVSEAYEVLSNPEKRVRYDQFGHNFERGAPGGGDPFGGMADIFSGSGLGDMFSDFFGARRGREGRGGARRGDNIELTLEISFEEAAFGTTAKFPVSRAKRCDTCTGSGAKPGSRPKACQTCGGTGEIRLARGFIAVATTCHDCHGAGRVMSDPCADCHGRGVVEHEDMVTSKVPGGVDSGMAIRRPGDGHSGERGGPPGDLIIHISVREHEFFTRHNTDVICELPISFAQAALGGSVVVPTLDGKMEVKIRPGTQAGQDYRLRGRGFPNLNGQGRGDQYVRVHVEVPEKLTSKQRDLLEQFSASMGETQNPRSSTFFNRVKEWLAGKPERAESQDETGS
jgi:molecular chaperone DnaJ